MLNRQALQPALRFFIRFILVGAGLSLLYGLLFERWLAVLAGLTNPLLGWGGTSMQLVPLADQMALVHAGLDGSHLTLRFSGYQNLHLHTVAAIALLAATSHIERSKRLLACAAALLLFALFQVGQLYIGTLLSLDQYWLQLGAAERVALEENGWRLAQSYRPLFESWFAWWNMWGGTGLALALWIYLTRGRPFAEDATGSSDPLASA